MVLPGDSEWKREALRKALEGGYETVVGVFPTPASATQALNALHAAGFTGEEVALVATGTEAADEILSQASAERTAQGLRRGMVMGGVLGGLIGVGAMAIPGVVPVAIAGWLAALLEGLFAGAFAGGLIGALVHHGVPRDVAQRYEEQLTHGNQLVMVLAKQGQQAKQARRLLVEAGSSDVQGYPYQARPEQFSGNLTHVMGAPQGAGPAAEAAGPLAERIEPGMVVLGADAEVIGRVKQVGAEDFLVDRELQTDVYVPFAGVRNVLDHEVVLRISRSEVNQFKERTAPGKEHEGWETPKLV